MTMIWDKKEFLKNIDYLVQKHCDGKQIKFNDRIDYRDAATKWKGKINPSLNKLAKICKEFNCSLVWPLTGKEFKNIDFKENNKLMELKEEQMLILKKYAVALGATCLPWAI